MIRNRQIPLFLACWLFGLGGMSFQIDKHFFQPSMASHPKDPLYLLLGSAKEVIGDTLFLKANSYFHGGVDLSLIPQEEALGHERKGDPRAEEPHESLKKAYTDWVYKINSRVKVMEHRHLQGDETKELLPFLSAAVKLDPYNVTAILTTAYWLNAYFKKTDASIEILRQGLEDNPGSWEISYHLGLDYFKYKKDYAQSSRYFENALEKMDKNNSSKIDHRDATYFLAESYRNQGLSRPALFAYQKTLTYFAESENLVLKSSILQKIKDLTENNHATKI